MGSRFAVVIWMTTILLLFAVFWFGLVLSAYYNQGKEHKSFPDVAKRFLPSFNSFGEIAKPGAVLLAAWFIYSSGHSAGSEATAIRIYQTYQDIAPLCNQIKMDYSFKKSAAESYAKKSQVSKERTFTQKVNDWFTPRSSERSE